jgi:imidazolonepropionase-like amidohydrolase
LIQEHRIVEVASCPLRSRGIVHRIDGAGKFLIPGLMDVHVHLGRGLFDSDLTEVNGVRLLHGYLYCGVTTIMDLGNSDAFIFGLRGEERSGRIVAPRILASGGIVTYQGGAGAANPSAIQTESWPQSIATLDPHIAMKPDMVSLIYDERGWGMYSMLPIMPLDLVRHVLEYYSENGVRTTAHLFSEYRAREAISAGIDTIGNTIIEAPVSNGFVKLMAEKRLPIASSLSSFDELGRLAEHPDFLDQHLYRATLEPAVIQALKDTRRADLLKDPWWAQWRKLMLPVGAENLRKIDAAGGVVALGTDVSVGPAVHRELELLVASGISPLDAIRIATLNSARFVGRESDLGSIEVGKLADLVLLDASPLTDINNSKQIDTVIKDGEVVDRARLDLPVNRAKR